MATNNIGAGAVVIGATLDPLLSGLARAKNALARWAADARKASGNVLSGFGSQFSSGIGGGLAKGLAFGSGAVAAVAGFQAIKESSASIRDTIADISRQAAAADAFGLTVEQFSGIAAVAKSAGEDTREFVESLVTLNKVSREGVAGTSKEAVKFFGDLNLNAKEFSQLRTDQQFFKFFEAASKVEDPIKRVDNAMVAFGEDGGKYLLPLLSKSPYELRQMAEAFAVSAEDAQAARAATERFARAGLVWSQTWRSIAVAAAPALGQVADEISGLRPVFEKVGRGAEVAFFIVGEAVKVAADSVGGFAKEILGIEDATLSVEAGVFAFFEGLALGGVGVVNVFKQIGAAVADVAAVVSDQLLNFARLRVELLKLTKIVLPNDPFDGENWDKEIAEDEAFIRKVEAANRKLTEFSQRQRESLLTGESVRKFFRDVDQKRADMKEEGVELKDPFRRKPAPDEKTRFASIVEAGSAEAFTLANRNLYDLGKAEKDDTPKRMLDEQKKTNRLTEKMIDILNRKLDFDTV